MLLASWRLTSSRRCSLAGAWQVTIQTTLYYRHIITTWLGPGKSQYKLYCITGILLQPGWGLASHNTNYTVLQAYYYNLVGAWQVTIQTILYYRHIITTWLGPGKSQYKLHCITGILLQPGWGLASHNTNYTVLQAYYYNLVGAWQVTIQTTLYYRHIITTWLGPGKSQYKLYCITGISLQPGWGLASHNTNYTVLQAYHYNLVGAWQVTIQTTLYYRHIFTTWLGPGKSQYKLHCITGILLQPGWGLASHNTNYTVLYHYNLVRSLCKLQCITCILHSQSQQLLAALYGCGHCTDRWVVI